ncbi:MAG: ExbD/TolR family protein [Burkholderiaceae bacterium]
MAFGGFDSREGPMRPMADINTTPLVDVMLVLLVIFIITAPLLTHAIRLDLPSAQAPVSAEKPETITLSIDGQERLFWNDAPVPDAAALRERLVEAARRTPQPELHLRADQQVRYQRIAEVMSAAQQAGVTRLGFVTDPRAGAAPAAAAKGAPAK